MLNVKRQRTIDKFISCMYPLWKDLTKEYDVEGVPFTIITDVHEWKCELDDITLTAEELRGYEMVTVEQPWTDDNGIITDISVGVLMGYPSAMTSIMSYDFDIQMALAHISITMRHEIGHILDYKRFLGHHKKEWNEYATKSEDMINALPALRKNASAKSILNWQLMYYDCLGEKQAYENTGITKKDVVIDFVKANPGMSRRQLGVEDYLTVDEFKQIMLDLKNKK